MVVNLGVILYEWYYLIKLDFSCLKIFGCFVFVYILKFNRGKLDSWIKRCLFLCLDEYIKVYWLYDLIFCKIILLRDVICDENWIGYYYVIEWKIKEE